MDTIKEIREVIVSLMDIGVAVLEEFSDGVQMRDFWKIASKLNNSPQYREAIGRAYNGSNKIPGELSQINGDEAIELVMIILPYLPKILKAASRKVD